MLIKQLNPSIPCLVTSKNNAEGSLLFIIDYSREDDLYFVVGMIESREIWVVPHFEIRLHKNWTLGCRPLQE